MAKNNVAQPTSVIHPGKAGDVMTVCVLGAPRGGTSAITGVIRSLDVFFGSDIDDASNEDLEFRAHRGNRAIFSSNHLRRERSEFISHSVNLIKSRNKERSVWGWKDPIAAEYIGDISDELRNPHFVLVVRDVAAIAQREAMAEQTIGGGKFFAYMLNAQSLYEKSVSFISKTGYPTIAVSYERFLRYPSEGARSIAEFLGYKGSDVASIADFARSYIKPDRLTASLKAVAPGRHDVSFSQEDSNKAYGVDFGSGARYKTDNLSASEVKALADELYSSAAGHLNSKRFLEAEKSISDIFDLFIGEYPALSGGKGRILSELSFFSVENGADLPFPDQVCGAFFMMGLTDLIQGRLDSSFCNLTMANLAIENRLSFDPPVENLEICRSLYWTTKLHLAKSALEVGRSDIVRYASLHFLNGKSWTDRKMQSFGGWDNYDDCTRRFELEVYNKSLE